MNNKTNKTFAVILAGGSGTRLQISQPKQFIELHKIPVIIWSARQFSRLNEVDILIVVVPESHIPHMQKLVIDYKLQKVKAIISGGTTRQGSSYNALCSHDFSNNDIILFHDAARPFVAAKLIKNTRAAALKDGASGVYVQAIDTIAEIEAQKVIAIPDREVLYYTQTPQAFRYSIIKNAHEQARLHNIDNATDDVSLVLSAGGQVTAVDGDYNNLKITTEFDFRMAEFQADNLKHIKNS